MKILILGAGRVGRSVAENLVSDANDITIVDESADRIAQMQERFDLRGIVGDASSPSVLSSAGAMDTDLLIALTASDETNLVACTLAAQIFNIPMRIARVRDSELRHYPRILGDEGFRATSVIWPEEALATQFSKLITFPAAQQVLNFADDKLTLFTVNCIEGAPLTGKTLEDAFQLLPNAKMRFVSIYRRNRRLECRNDTVIEGNVVIKGNTEIGSDCYITSGSRIVDSKIGNNVTVTSSTVEEAEMDDNTDIGPNSHLRPKAIIRKGAHIGNFVEIKKAEIGENTKVGHLTYVGDATLGKDINIGCGTIFSNYDGVKKFHTNVGDHAFIGAGSTLIAPINVADHAFIAADTTVTKDVNKYDMAIGRGRQVNKPDYWHKLPLSQDKEWD